MDGSKPGDDTTAKIVKTIDAGDGKPPIEMVDISKNPDVGFRVFKLDDTNMKDVYYSADEYSQTNLEELESNIKEDRTDLDLLFGCLLDWGLPLSMPYRSEKIDNCTVHTYAPGDVALNVPDALIACFDSNVPENVIKEKSPSASRAVQCSGILPLPAARKRSTCLKFSSCMRQIPMSR